MNDCLVVGRPNVGKTTFVVNFAEYMGLKKIKIYVQQPAGYTSIKNYRIKDARNKLISNKPNFTKNIQTIKLEVPAGKIKKSLKLIDTCGLKDGIHSDPDIRKSMAKTLKKITKTNLILHMIDIKNINKDHENKNLLSSVDNMILKYSKIDKKYAILINKIDIIDSVPNTISFIKNKLNFKYIFPVSSKKKKGFQKVKKLVLKYV